MHVLDREKYLLDGIPITGSAMIDEACHYDETFANDWMKSTSVAARILREHGHTVEENIGWEDNDG